MISTCILGLVHAFPDEGRRERVREIYRAVSELEDREKYLRELLVYIRENVTNELVAQGDCYCELPSGDCPCAYCASKHFNEASEGKI